MEVKQKNKMAVVKKCKLCGREFTTTDERHEYCVDCLLKLKDIKTGGDRGGR